MRGRPLLLIATLACGDATAAERPCPAVPPSESRRLIEATCRDLKTRLSKVPGASVRSGGKSFLDPRMDCTRQGCVVTLKGWFSALRGEPSPDSWLGEYLEGKGWTRLLTHDADGPDGTVYALHRPGALCVVEGRWSHSHEDSGESVDSDDYEVSVSCGGAEKGAPQPPS